MLLSIALALSVTLYLYSGTLHWQLMRAYDWTSGVIDEFELAEACSEGLPMAARLAINLAKGTFILFWPAFLAYGALADRREHNRAPH